MAAKKKTVRKKKTTRKKEYVIFACNGSLVWFLTVNSQWTGRNGKGKFVTNNLAFAKRIAATLNRSKSNIGVTEKKTSNAEILRYCLPAKT